RPAGMNSKQNHHTSTRLDELPRQGLRPGGRKRMKPRKSVITLAVSNLDRALRFYRDGLGLDSAGVIGTEFTGDKTNPSGAVAMFRLQEGLILALYPRTELAKERSGM